jgi:anti-sigma regulatory factor (Ser/Thr protein kinase)
VIVNLLTNAMKYGKGKPLEIKVFSDHLKEKAFLCVSDNGMGVREVDQERIHKKESKKCVSEMNPLIHVLLATANSWIGYFPQVPLKEIIKQKRRSMKDER